jgi:hypothetical protein
VPERSLQEVSHSPKGEGWGEVMLLVDDVEGPSLERC